MSKGIVVTGIGVISAAGADKAPFWNHISKGISAIKPLSGLNTAEFNSHTGAEITNFNPRDYTGRKSIRNLDRISSFAIAAAYLALKDARLRIDSHNSLDTGIVLGSMFGSWSSIAEFHSQMLNDKLKRVNPLLFPNTVPNSPTSQASIEFGIKGLNNSLCTGLASGTDAIGWGLDYLRRGRAKIMLAGGIEELTLWTMGTFDKLEFLAKETKEITEGCRPFDKNRNGLVLGEGGAVLVLETMENAHERNANIYAEVIGYGSTYDAYADGKGLERAIRLAIDEARIKPEDIQYISAEGNSVIPDDRIETNTYKNSFGDHIYRIPLSSIKPIIGHTLGAAGAFNAAACILAMQEGIILPTINYEEPDPECGLDYVPNVAREKSIPLALSVSFSPKGNCACLIFRLI